MGVVYRARQVRLNRPCALKMILGGAHACARGGRPLPGRGGGRRPVAAPQHRADPPHRRGRRPAVLRAGVRRRRQPGPAARRHALAGTRAAELIESAGARRRRGASSGHRPPRPEAGQHPAGGRRHAQDHRLRPGQVAGLGQRPDADRLDHGLARLHGPRAGRGQDQGGRAARRRLRPGRDPVRAADRRPAVPGYDRPGDSRSGQEHRAGAAVAAGPRPAAGRRDDRAEMLAEGAGEALRLGRRGGRGPAAVPRAASRSSRGRFRSGSGPGAGVVGTRSQPP